MIKPLDNLTGKGLLIHHWDTDGITSAALLLHHLKDNQLSTKTPTLGNYYLTETELKECQNYDYTIICDMALPHSNLDILSTNKPLLIFDHHLQEKHQKALLHYNPIIDGKNPEDYPSASWITNTYLQNLPNLYSLLGVIGDHECTIEENPIFKAHIQTLQKKHQLTFQDLLTMVYLLDSNYKIGDKKAVEEAPHQLNDNWQDPNYILNHKEWKKNHHTIQEELKTHLTAIPQPEQGIITKTMHNSYNLISTITRKIYWQTQQPTIVINTGYFPEHDQLYARAKKDLEPMIQQGKQLGFNCGGKKQVLGAIVPKAQTQHYLELLKKYLQA